MDTIYALSTAPGRAGLAVIRASGPHVLQGLKALTGRSKIEPRKAIFARLADSVSRETIDHGIVIFFEGPASFTGEDSVEYTVHGGRAVVQSLLSALAALPDHRLAEPGEFTRRAFENGKLDLTEAEAVADLIHAETELQKQQALSQLSGSLSTLYQGWTDRLKATLAHMEAEIEFPDEDLPEDLAQKFAPEIQALHHDIAAHLADNRRGERLRDGIQIAVVGAPNAGKSSLVNALAQRDVAIVSDMAGTTRDVIEVHLDIAGYPVILADTAGLRPDQIGAEGHEAIESEGIRRALARAESADIKLLVFDGTEKTPDPHTLNLLDDTALAVSNKSDSGGGSAPGIAVSAKTGAGLDELLKVIESRLHDLMGVRTDNPSLTRQRHRTALEEALVCLARAPTAPLPELIAEDLRLAIRALGRITGRVDVEDLLDVIFRDFCIGK
ncbi:MAG: tRNA uridine-5-carboxymethylaminomethyl(34) synthesis GTPase MnmE [Alphaproteobacteria bacterium]|nr:tRNA uridine-5-carboxymethylaminomethyl(34) synthesis GTPase MnmE [Alphaproteobacteria bacterium]